MSTSSSPTPSGSSTQPRYFPFSAIVGQEKMKRALLLNLVDPSLGGVLILGEKGTAKSTIVRALSQLLEGLSVVELPIATTEDKLVGSIDVEHALATGELRFAPGILARAHGQILYVDEVNLLEDYLVDILLDVAAMGVNHIEREGISHSHPARFTLVGTMNPEEGHLRPQLLDRFALSVEVRGERSVAARREVLQRRLDYERDPEAFCARYREEEEQLGERLRQARLRLPQLRYAEPLVELVARLGIELQVDGHRSDIMLLKAALATAALEGVEELSPEHVYTAAELVLPHRLRRLPFEERYFAAEDIRQLCERLFTESLNKE